MKPARYLQAASAAFPQPTEQQRGYSGEQHSDRTLVQGVKGRKYHGDQSIGQAERAPTHLKPVEQEVVQAQSKHGFFSDRRDQQQGEQGSWGAGCGAKTDATVQSEPGTNRSASEDQAVGSEHGPVNWLHQGCHCLRMIVALALLLGPVHSFAGLGQDLDSNNVEHKRMAAQHRVMPGAQYSLHEFQSADGSRFRQYVSSSGMVFAVSWRTLYKPDLSALLGTSYPGYSAAARVAAQRTGVQRYFQHDDLDLVLQSSAYLHVFSGFAFRRSMLPRGVNPEQIGLE